MEKITLHVKNRLNRKFYFLLIALLISFIGTMQEINAQTTRTVGTTGANYVTLKEAFDSINAGKITGELVLQIVDNTTETATAALNASGSGSALYTSVSIYPTITGLSVNGNLALPLIDLNGADNVTINGSLNGLNGGKDLSIINTNITNTNGTSTIRFINDASNNTVKYCTIKGSSTALYVNAASTGGGVILFGTATITGNDSNTIDNNDITNAGGNRPVYAINSYGGNGFANSENTISNNNIYDFLNRGITSKGIYLNLNSSAWMISGNSFYETATFVPTASVLHNVIHVDNTGGVNITIQNNFIGGSSSNCTGTWTKTAAFDNIFNAIYFRGGIASTSNIQGNTIKNFVYANSGAAAWYGIAVAAGNVNVGTTAGNIIGAPTGNGSISFTGGATNANFYGIQISTATSTTTDVQNNTIGSVTLSNALTTAATNFYGISKLAALGTTIISNNTIGSTDAGTTNSIWASSTSTTAAQNMYGINSNSAGSVTISGNTISKLTNSTADIIGYAGVVNGILATGQATSGAYTITNNTVRDLTNSNAGALVTNLASVSGIVLMNTVALENTISGNTIYNLTNTYTSFTGGVIGIYFSGSTMGSNVTGNFIHSLSTNSGFTSATNLYGIKIAAGAGTFSNNIISLGGINTANIYGIYETGAVNNNNNLYFNTISVGGELSSQSSNSYALYSAVSTNTRDFRNNILNNTRTNNGGGGKHFAVYLNYTVNTGLTINNNDYVASGTGGMLGYHTVGTYNAVNDIVTLAAWQTSTAQDGNSISVSPLFADPIGTSALNYNPAATLPGVSGTGIMGDYSGFTRGAIPQMGAIESLVASNAVDVYVGGVLQVPSYINIKDAFAKINDGTYTGDIVLKITGNQVLSATASLNASGTGSASYTSVNIYPVLTGLSISGNLGAPLIDLNGASNVTFDGRLNATGTTKDLTLVNTSASSNTGTSTVQFINGASNNTLKYCYVKSSSMGFYGGALFFYTTTGITGNNNNTIENNDITNGVDAKRPVFAIFSIGSAGKDNTGNIISNNNIYNFLNRGSYSAGIYLYSNTTDWTISGNKFYETASFAPTASVAYQVIYIDNVTTGNNFTISNNVIGGNAADGSGFWTKTAVADNAFNAIYMNVATVTPSNIQGNIIKNFLYANPLASNWYGINLVAGNVNVGTTSGNTIGAATGSSSITYTGSTTNTNFYGINIPSTGIIDVRNNTIGSITVGNTIAGNATNFYGIYKLATTGTTTISNNTIGTIDPGTPYGIIASSPSSTAANAQTVYGIFVYNSVASTSITNISGNTVSKLKNGTTNITAARLGTIGGIVTTVGINTITNNTVSDLTIANANTAATYQASVVGIAQNSTANAVQNITGNRIYNLSNTYASFAGNVNGIYIYGPSTTSSSVSNNVVSNIFVTGATSTTANLYGIKVLAGKADYVNNSVSMEGNTTSNVYGLSLSGMYIVSSNIYYNSVYVGGTPITGALNSYAFYSNDTWTSSSRDIKNNIFNNARINGGTATGKNYAAYIASVGTTLCDYNDYFTSGTGGVLGFNAAADQLVLPVVSAQDAASISQNPQFTTTTNLLPQTGSPVTGAGVSIAGFTTDILGTTRNLTTPTMGAYELVVVNKILTLDSVMLQGLYLGKISGVMTMSQAVDANGIHCPAGVADSITLELHSATSYSTIAYSALVPLGITGTVTVTVPNAINGSYYITIKHRNSLETTSATAVSFAGDAINHSFGSPAKVYGGNLQLMIDGIYTIFAGDVDQSGAIDTADMTPIENDSFNFMGGYLNTDTNGDGAIDTGDMTNVINNSNNFVGTVHP